MYITEISFFQIISQEMKLEVKLTKKLDKGSEIDTIIFKFMWKNTLVKIILKYKSNKK